MNDPKATAVILLAHGSARDPGAVATLEMHAAKALERSSFAAVRLACLQGGPSVADALAGIATPRLIAVPMTMSAGIVADELLSRLRAQVGGSLRIDVVKPLGSHAEIAEIAADTGADAARRAALLPADVRLVMVAHGASGDDRNRLAAERHADVVRRTGRFAGVSLAYIDEAPFLADVLTRVEGPAVAVGLFAAPGAHAVLDIRAALEGSGRKDIVDAGPVGADPRIADLIVSLAQSAGTAD